MVRDLPFSMNKKPLITIILPVHNSDKFLLECLKSLKRQTYKNIEVLAIDDSSKDSSYKILKDFRKKDPRFKVGKNVKRYGIVMTLNRLLKKAKGDYIVFCDSTDFMHRDRVKKQFLFLKTHPEIVAVGTQCLFIKKDGRRIKKSKFPQENSQIYSSPLHGISMQFETVMINKTMLPKDILKFDSNIIPFIYSDFLIKLLPFGKFANLSSTLHYHRNNPNIYLRSAKTNPYSFVKLWLKSVMIHDYSPSVRSLFSPLMPKTT